MADGYWNRQQPLPYPPSASLLKRPRSDYEPPPSGLPSSQEMHNYLPRDDEHGLARAAQDPKTIGSAYERYLQNQIPSYGSGEGSTYGGGLARPPPVGGMPGYPPIPDPALMGRPGPVGSDVASNGRGLGYGGQLPLDPMARPVREPAPLPADASNTLYVEGLPANTSKREVAHIFRPFVGYKEARLVSKESKHRGGDPLILCFVDFINPACAATALSALQGYKMDEHDPDSAYLRLQFSRYPGPRTGSGPRSGGRGKR